VPDTRTHRGPHPDDARQFAAETVPSLRAAVDELSWLLTRGYSPRSAQKLVGDRHGLLARQRVAVARCSCGKDELQSRRRRMVEPAAVRAQPVWLDGYNVLTTIEAALAGGVVLAGRDGCWRDMASMHGSYRRVAETRPALDAIGRVLDRLGTGECVWWLDRPVSNSGRLRTIIQEVAAATERLWRVELVPDPDPLLMAADAIVATADSAILDGCRRWLNLARMIVEAKVPQAWLIDLP
jgi:hypothetical protein